jgi:hypothetical protein
MPDKPLRNFDFFEFCFGDLLIEKLLMAIAEALDSIPDALVSVLRECVEISVGDAHRSFSELMQSVRCRRILQRGINT